MRIRYLALGLLLLRPETAAAEWQIKPFVGLTFGGNTTLVLEKTDRTKPVFGVTGVLLGNVFGVDADVGRAPGFFESVDQDSVSLLRQGSRVTTLTGDLIVAMPKRMTEYTLRPYFVAGMGLIHVNIDGRLNGVLVSSTLPAMDFGGGATGFVNDRVGVSWEVRHFRSFNGQARGNSFGDEQLSFWRANMALTIRYGK